MRTKMRNAECGLRNCPEQRLLRTFIPQSEFRIPNSPRSGISLVEVLISMFVLLFGLMGVAFIFPVGNQYVVDGEKFDLGSSLAQNAFEELKARGMLRPKFWLYADRAEGRIQNNQLFIQDTASPGFFNVPLPINPGDPHPGHVFVLDPMGGAAGFTAGITELEGFPLWDLQSDSETETLGMLPAWRSAMIAANVVPGGTWPVHRITLPQAGGIPLTSAVAETIFRLRDDLAVEQPEEDDRPSIQRWDISSGGSLLRRQYEGNYSWLATVVPTSDQALISLQPGAVGRISQALYDVSVVVFRKREETPSATSERLIRAEILNDGELALYSTNTNIDAAVAEVDSAVDEIRPGNWIAVMGVNQTTGDFMLKWYRLLALDRETDDVSLISTTTIRQGRYAMLDGPDWPDNSFVNLRAVILPGAISVATQQMEMEE